MSHSCTPEARTHAVVKYFETLSPETVSQLATHYASDARFKDPFNDVQGLPAIEAIFQHMFRTLRNPRFVVTGKVCEGAQCFLTWDFLFATRTGAKPAEFTIRGSTHLVYAQQPDGAWRIAWHRDYWDAAEELYEKLPVLGVLMRWLKQRARS
jgi:ketosteroid isomerase-like protein